jgi:drug/metabolite transporter (DMT)-like permease
MAGMSDNARGALLMMAAMAGFTLNDTCLKALSDELPLYQALFLRGVATTLFLYLLARAMGGLKLDLAPRDWGIVALRTVAEIAAAYFFLTGLFHMPLANATAILQSLPLAITLAGALFLGEAVGWRRVSAIVIGFFGVMLIVRPGAEGFTVYSLYVLAAVACVTVRDLSTRRVSRGVPSLTVALAGSAGVTLFGAAGCLGGAWAPISGLAAAQLLGATVFVILGYVCSVMVMRTGDIGFVALFRYTGLIWALALGLVVFGQWPAPLTLAGAAIVAATGLFTLWRERKRRPPPAAVPAGRAFE